jgi:hypothetical protein
MPGLVVDIGRAYFRRAAAQEADSAATAGVGRTCHQLIFAFYSPMRYNLLVSLKMYLVTFDLLQPGDYRSLRERLRTLEARQILDNQWALRSVSTATDLKNVLREFLHDGDRIVVAEVGAEWASRRALENLGKV